MKPAAFTKPRSARSGMTLVELLVVVGIILLVASIAIPAFQPAAEQRPLREGARLLKSLLEGARLDAMESGRPVGVLLERLPQNPNACFVAYQVEAFTQRYGGETVTARVRVAIHPSGDLVLRVGTGAIADDLIQPGDLMQLNHQGPWYPVGPIGPPGSGNRDANGNGLLDFRDVDNDGWCDDFLWLQVPPGVAAIYTPPWPRLLVPPPGPNFGPPVPFVIEQLPGRDAANPNAVFGRLFRSAVPSVRFSGGAVIDLSASGTDSFPRALEATGPDEDQDRDGQWDGDANGNSRFDVPAPIIIVFAPDGSLGQVYHMRRLLNSSGQIIGLEFASQRLTETLFLLVGDWEHMPASARDMWPPYPKMPPAMPPSAADDTLYNWQVAKNLWVAIEPRSGSVYVAPVFAEQHDAVRNIDIASSIVASRTFARQTQVGTGGPPRE